MSIKTDTADAVKVIADAAAKASEVIASAAAEALKVKRDEDAGDHNLLIKLDTKVDQIQADVAALKNQDKNNITQEQHNGLCTKTDDHESRLRFVEKSVTQIWTYGTAGIIALGIIEFLINKFL